MAPPLGSTSRTLFTIADKLVPVIKDDLMDENGRDQSVSISHNQHVQERGFWPFSQGYCLDIVGSNSCRIVMEDATFFFDNYDCQSFDYCGSLKFFLCLKVKKPFC